MGINWEEVRQQMIEATAGMNPENLMISVETIQNISGQKMIHVTISEIDMENYG